MGSLYVTNDNAPNPYDTLPPYLENLFRVLDIDTDRLYGDITVSNSLGVGVTSSASSLNLQGSLIAQILPNSKRAHCDSEWDGWQHSLGL